jgi:hypothetical protein
VAADTKPLTRQRLVQDVTLKGHHRLKLLLVLLFAAAEAAGWLLAAE